MVGKKSGVGSQLAIQPKALLTYYFGYSLSVAVKDLTSRCKVLGDVMCTVGEITVLVKFPSKEKRC